MTVEEIFDLCAIDPWFLEQLARSSKSRKHSAEPA